MFKPFLLLAAMTLALSIATHAQAPKVAYSAPFPEPMEGAARLLYLKNGNTFYFQFTVKHGIDVVLYNDQHQEKKTFRLTGKLWNRRDMKHTYLRGIHEINGQAVIFLSQSKHKTYSLYRIILDGSTGNLLKEDKLGLTAENTGGTGYEDPVAHGIYVVKDPESDYYATIVSGWAEEQKKKFLLITHYAPDHTEINRGIMEAPLGFKKLSFQQAYVHRGDYVFLENYGWNNDKGTDGKIVVTSFTKGDHPFRHQALDQTLGFWNINSGIQYNPINKTVALLTILNADNQAPAGMERFHGRPYVYSLINLDPATLEVKHAGYVDDATLCHTAATQLQLRKDLQGKPQDFRINPDGSVAVLLEELSQVQDYEPENHHMHYFSSFGNIGIAELDTSYKATNYAFAKSQSTFGRYSTQWRNYCRNTGDWTFPYGGPLFPNFTIAYFFSYQYLHPGNTTYVMFNDYPRNIRDTSFSARNKKTVQAISESTTVCYRMQQGKTEKFLLYGDTGGENIYRYTMLETSVYTEDQKKMVTIVLEKHGHKDPKAHVAWIDFE